MGARALRRYVVAEVDARDLTPHRLLAAFERVRGGDLPVAFLAFGGDPAVVELVHVDPDHRRRGVASALLAAARRERPGVGYSADHTATGAAWARAAGLAVPTVDALVDDAEVAWAASTVYLHLTHVEPEELLWRRPLRPRRGRRWGGRR